MITLLGYEFIISMIELISFGLVFDFPDFKSFRTVNASVNIMKLFKD